MALTVTQISTPNAPITEGTLFHYKARMVDITFDASYLTTGEVLTAANLGWNTIVGVIVVNHAKNAAGTLVLPVVAAVNTAQTQAAFQLYRYDGAAVGKASLEEAAGAFDASLFTARVIVLGS